jgi:hypothetical protein
MPKTIDGKDRGPARRAIRGTLTSRNIVGEFTPRLFNVAHAWNLSGDNLETTPSTGVFVSKNLLNLSPELDDFPRKSGAGEGIRTLDPNLGKVVLYP